MRETWNDVDELCARIHGELLISTNGGKKGGKSRYENWFAVAKDTHFKLQRSSANDLSSDRKVQLARHAGELRAFAFLASPP